MQPLLEVKNLKTQFITKKGTVVAVDDVSFKINKGEILGIVGESGCGKSVTSLSILRLLPEIGEIADGTIMINGKNLAELSEAQMCDVRGNEIAMIFQDPMTSLNPVLTIKKQLIEPLMIHQNLGKKEAEEKALEMLKKVGIPSPERRINEYPHQLSGGMRQRVMIAMALSCKPSLLIADEPTTALDVTIQAQILQLMSELRDSTNTAIMLITHDMGVVAEMADYIMVMYAGKVVEYADAKSIFKNPKHPYTQGLLHSIPRLDGNEESLYTITGTVPNQYNMPEGCRFRPRCPYAKPICQKEQPGTYQFEGSQVSCWKFSGGGEYGK